MMCRAFIFDVSTVHLFVNYSETNEMIRCEVMHILYFSFQ